MKFIKSICIASILFSGCFGDKYYDGPDYFTDDFEAYNSYEEMLLPEDVLWSFTQITYPENNITIDSMQVHTGNRCIEFFCYKSNV